MSKKKFATTVRLDWDTKYIQSAQIIDIPEPWSAFNYRFIDEIRIFLAVLQAARRNDTILIFSSRGKFKPELLAAIIIGFWPCKFRPLIAMYGEMYQPDTGLKLIFERFAMRLADRSIARYIIGSQAEIPIFSRLWSISQDKIRVCYEYTRVQRSSVGVEEIHKEFPESKNSYIFAGGNSFRNFEPLVEVAKRRPEVTFHFGTSRLLGRNDLPSNITTGLVSPGEYAQLIRNATAVIVPISLDVKRIVGVLTYLEAMAQGKIVIVTSAPGTTEYIQHSNTGYIVDGSIESYLKIVDFVLDPSSQSTIELVSKQAREVTQSLFSKDAHINRLLGIMDELISQEGH